MFPLLRSYGKLLRTGLQLGSQTRNCTQSTYGEKSINQVMLLGRSGGKPQRRGTEENPVVVFSMATNTYHRHEQGDVTQHVQWHRISVFRPLLRETVVANLTKGQRVLVRGSISYFSVQDHFNKTSTVTTIVADDVIFLSKAGQVEDVPEEEPPL